MIWLGIFIGFILGELNELIEELFESKSYIRGVKIKEILKEPDNF